MRNLESIAYFFSQSMSIFKWYLSLLSCIFFILDISSKLMYTLRWQLFSLCFKGDEYNCLSVETMEVFLLEFYLLGDIVFDLAVDYSPFMLCLALAIIQSILILLRSLITSLSRPMSVSLWKLYLIFTIYLSVLAALLNSSISYSFKSFGMRPRLSTAFLKRGDIMSHLSVDTYSLRLSCFKLSLTVSLRFTISPTN